MQIWDYLIDADGELINAPAMGIAPDDLAGRLAELGFRIQAADSAPRDGLVRTTWEDFLALVAPEIQDPTLTIINGHVPDDPPERDVTDDGLVLVMPEPTRALELWDPRGETKIETMDAAEIGRLMAEGWIPLRSDGTEFDILPFMGGVLFDGTPLNVILGQGWIETQQDYLADLIAEGLIPEPWGWGTDATISLEALPPGARFAGFGGGWIAVGASVLGLAWFARKMRKAGGRRAWFKT